MRHTHMGQEPTHLQLGDPVGVIHVLLSTVRHPLTVCLIDQLPHLQQWAGPPHPLNAHYSRPPQQAELTPFFTSLLKLFSVPLYPEHRQQQSSCTCSLSLPLLLPHLRPSHCPTPTLLPHHPTPPHISHCPTLPLLLPHPTPPTAPPTYHPTVLSLVEPHGQLQHAVDAGQGLVAQQDLMDALQGGREWEGCVCTHTCVVSVYACLPSSRLPW